MIGQDFLDWMNKADCKNAADIVRLLGVGRNQAQEWLVDAKDGKAVTVKPTIALAMSATAAALPPWPYKDNAQ